MTCCTDCCELRCCAVWKAWLWQVGAVPTLTLLTFLSSCPRWFSVSDFLSFLWNFHRRLTDLSSILFYLVLPSVSVRISTWYSCLLELPSKWPTDSVTWVEQKTSLEFLYIKLCLWLFANSLWNVMDALLHHIAKVYYLYSTNLFLGKNYSQ